jgi:hypothetical protein
MIIAAKHAADVGDHERGSMMEPAEEAKGLEPGHYLRPCGAESVLCVLIVHRTRLS